MQVLYSQFKFHVENSLDFVLCEYALQIDHSNSNKWKKEHYGIRCFSARCGFWFFPSFISTLWLQIPLEYQWMHSRSRHSKREGEVETKRWKILNEKQQCFCVRLRWISEFLYKDFQIETCIDLYMYMSATTATTTISTATSIRVNWRFADNFTWIRRAKLKSNVHAFYMVYTNATWLVAYTHIHRHQNGGFTIHQALLCVCAVCTSIYAYRIYCDEVLTNTG